MPQWEPMQTMKKTKRCYVHLVDWTCTRWLWKTYGWKRNKSMRKKIASRGRRRRDGNSGENYDWGRHHYFGVQCRCLGCLRRIGHVWGQNYKRKNNRRSPREWRYVRRGGGGKEDVEQATIKSSGFEPCNQEPRSNGWKVMWWYQQLPQGETHLSIEPTHGYHHLDNTIPKTQLTSTHKNRGNRHQNILACIDLDSPSSLVKFIGGEGNFAPTRSPWPQLASTPIWSSVANFIAFKQYVMTSWHGQIWEFKGKSSLGRNYLRAPVPQP